MGTTLKNDKAAIRRAPAAQVEQAIVDIQRYRGIGLASLEKDGERLPYAKSSAIAKRLHMNSDMLRKARAFADAKKGYSQADLEELFTLMRKYGRAIGTSYILRLVTLHKPSRRKVQTKALKEGWSCRELDASLRIGLGNRRPRAGRRPRVAESPGSVRYQLMRISQQWQRACEAILPEEGTSTPAGFGKKQKKATEKARKAVQLLVDYLQKACSSDLRKSERGLFDEEVLKPAP